MHIYRPLSQQQGEQSIEWYQIKKKIQKIQLTDTIEHLLFEFQDDANRTFLLDEELFELVRYPVEGMLYEPLKIEQLTNLIESKIREVKQQENIKGSILLYDIDHIRVDGEQSNYLLGQTGHLQRDIFLVFIKPSLALSCPTLATEKPSPYIYPSSYFTVQFISKQLSIPSFIMVSFHEHTIKLILVKDWFYHNIHTLDRGINNLKQILISNNIIAYLSKSDTEIQHNSLVATILEDNMKFYINIVIDRLQDHNEGITSCIISYPEFKNNILYQTFIDTYQSRIGWYIIPNSIHHQLETYDRERQTNELDILTYLNFAESKELI